MVYEDAKQRKDDHVVCIFYTIYKMKSCDESGAVMNKMKIVNRIHVCSLGKTLRVLSSRYRYHELDSVDVKFNYLLCCCLAVDLCRKFVGNLSEICRKYVFLVQASPKSMQ